MLTAPSPGLLARETLLGKLAAARGRAVWLGAPAGYGKSSLAKAHAERHGLAIWLRAGAADADPASFFAHLAAAAGCRLPAPLPEQLREPAAFARLAFAELWAQKPAHLLVLDELETVAEPLQAVLAELLAGLPPDAQLLLTSRQGPPPALARAATQQRLLRLSSRELRLSRGEVALLAAQRGQQLDAIGLDALMLQTHGWPAAVMLALLSASRRPSPDEVLLAQYLRHEVWPGFDPDTQEQLLLAAQLPAITPLLEAAWPRLQGLLALMERFAHEGLFVLAEQGPRYVLHPLLRDFLRREGEARWPAPALHATRLQAAQALCAAREGEAAVPLFIELQAWGELTRLLPQLAPRLLAQSRFAELGRWLSALPEALCIEQPDLAYVSGLLRLLTAPGKARVHLLRALAGYSARDNAPGQLRTLAHLAYLSFVDCTPDYPMTHWLPALQRLAPSLDALAAEERLQVATTVVHALLVGEPAHPELPLWRGRLQHLLAQPLPLASRLRGASVLGIHLLWSGRHAELQALPLLLGPALAQSGVSDYNRLVWGLVELDLCWAGGRLHEAPAVLGRLRQIAARSSVHSLATYHQLLASDALLAAGELDAAEQLMREAEATLVPAQVTEIWHLALQRAWLALWRGDAAAMQRQAQAAIAAAQAIGSPICEAFGWMALGQAELLAGRLEALQAMLPQLDEQAARAGSRLVDALHRLLRGCAHGAAEDWQALRALLLELPRPPLFTRGLLDALQ